MPCKVDLLTIAQMHAPDASSHHLGVAIVVHNSALAQLRTALATLRVALDAALRDGQLRSASVHVVDNASQPDYRQSVQALLADLAWQEPFLVAYVQNDSNAGFGAGHNLALSHSRGDFHLILNPDVELAPQALAAGLECLRSDSGVVALSPRVVGPAGAREYLCKRYPSLLVLGLRAYAPAGVQRWFSARLAHYDMRDECGDVDPVDVEIISGCFMLCRSDDLRAIGGFDERYFLYFEDFDLSLRLRQRGTLRYLPAMNIVHHGGYVARKGWRHLGWFVRSAVRFFNGHGWRFI